MAMFAITARVPIIPAVFRREGWCRHGFTRLPTILPDPSLGKEADAKRITAAVIAQVDAAIHSHPDQWFWYNKRWVLTPIREDAAEAGAPAPKPI